MLALGFAFGGTVRGSQWIQAGGNESGSGGGRIARQGFQIGMW